MIITVGKPQTGTYQKDTPHHQPILNGILRKRTDMKRYSNGIMSSWWCSFVGVSCGSTFICDIEPFYVFHLISVNFLRTKTALYINSPSIKLKIGHSFYIVFRTLVRWCSLLEIDCNNNFIYRQMNCIIMHVSTHSYISDKINQHLEVRNAMLCVAPFLMMYSKLSNWENVLLACSKL